MTPIERIEVQRLAMNAIKRAIKARGHKVSDYDRRDLLKAARALIRSPDGKALLASARRNITRTKGE